MNPASAVASMCSSSCPATEMVSLRPTSFNSCAQMTTGAVRHTVKWQGQLQAGAGARAAHMAKGNGTGRARHRVRDEGRYRGGTVAGQGA